MFSYDDYFDIDNNSSLLTNFNKSERLIYEKAINEYKKRGGNLDIYILDEAYWDNGYLDESMNSLHTNNRRMDRTEFWNIFEYVKYGKPIPEDSCDAEEHY